MLSTTSIIRLRGAAAVYDVERGLLSGIQPMFWQTDTSIAKNSCTYTPADDFKDLSPPTLTCR